MTKNFKTIIQSKKLKNLNRMNILARPMGLLLAGEVIWATAAAAGFLAIKE